MTLGDIDQMVVELLMEYEGSAPAGDVFARQRMIKRAVDWFAQKTDAFWYSFTQVVNNNQTSYCAPMLYKLRSVNYVDDNAYYHPMIPKTTGEMDQEFGYFSWRNWTADYVQLLVPYVILDGMNSVQMAPPPVVPNPIVSPAVNPLLEFEGYAIPSKAFKRDGVTPLFALPTDECPLNALCHPGIAYQVMVERTTQRPTDENKARLPLLQEQRDEYLQKLGSVAFAFKPPYRYGEARFRWMF